MFEVAAILDVATLAGSLLFVQYRLRGVGRSKAAIAEPEAALRTADASRINAMQIAMSSLIAELATRRDLAELVERARFQSLQLNKEIVNVTGDDEIGSAVAADINLLFDNRPL